MIISLRIDSRAIDRMRQEISRLRREIEALRSRFPRTTIPTRPAPVHVGPSGRTDIRRPAGRTTPPDAPRARA